MILHKDLRLFTSEPQTPEILKGHLAQTPQTPKDHLALPNLLNPQPPTLTHFCLLPFHLSSSGSNNLLASLLNKLTVHPFNSFDLSDQFFEAVSPCVSLLPPPFRLQLCWSELSMLMHSLSSAKPALPCPVLSAKLLHRHPLSQSSRPSL